MRLMLLRINRQDAKNAKSVSNRRLFIISWGILSLFFLAFLASWRLIQNPRLTAFKTAQ
jgi:hypothetical protein